MTRAIGTRLSEVEERLEFVRSEILYELRYGERARGSVNKTTVQEIFRKPKVLNLAKRSSLGDDIHINIGAGHRPLEGYVNVDVRELDGIDIVADIRSLPFAPDEVSVIFCAHLLEHFPLEEVRRSLLPYWYSLLRPGGKFVAVVPDAEAMLNGYNRGEISFEVLRQVTFGGQEYEGDFHFNMYSRAALKDLLAEVGFDDPAITVTGRSNGLCYEMEATGRRPEGEVEMGGVSTTE